MTKPCLSNPAQFPLHTSSDRLHIGKVVANLALRRAIPNGGSTRATKEEEVSKGSFRLAPIQEPEETRDCTAMTTHIAPAENSRDPAADGRALKDG